MLCSEEGSVRGEEAGLFGRAVHGAVAELRATFPAPFACSIVCHWRINAVSACFFVVCSEPLGSTDFKSA